MESLQNIKRRLKSVNNIDQITRAMELVAATKMRRSQEIALNSRPYAFAALDLLAKLSETEQVSVSPLLEKRPVKSTAVVLITSDKGLAGSFNSSVIRAFEKSLRSGELVVSKESDHFIAVGQKAAAYLEKSFTLQEKFIRAGDFTTVEEVLPVTEHLTNGFLSGKWDRVLVFSTHFRSALRQTVHMREILPVTIDGIRRTLDEIVPETGHFSELRKANGVRPSHFSNDYLIEPSPEAVLKELIPHLVMMQVYHLILEANASEHAARRVAMKNASDNASELAEKLTVVYNKSRQAGITRELIEITAGAEVLEQ